MKKSKFITPFLLAATVVGCSPPSLPTDRNKCTISNGEPKCEDPTKPVGYVHAPVNAYQPWILHSTGLASSGRPSTSIVAINNRPVSVIARGGFGATAHASAS